MGIHIWAVPHTHIHTHIHIHTHTQMHRNPHYVYKTLTKEIEENR